MSLDLKNTEKQLLPVRIIGDPVLRRKAEHVKKINDEIKTFANRLVDSMFAFDGLGMAAPQVGSSVRMLALCVPRPEDPAYQMSPGESFLLPKMPLILINPEILEFGNEKNSREEGCLSVPEIYAPVERPTTISVYSQFIDGSSATLLCGGLLARAIQHEIDHLDGILFIDRLASEDSKRIQGKLRRLQKKSKKHNFKRSA